MWAWVVLSALLLVAPAAAQEPRPDLRPERQKRTEDGVRCFAYDKWVAQIHDEYGEDQVAAMMVEDGRSVIIITVNPEKETWTIGERFADGMVCPRSSGTGIPQWPAPMGRKA